MTPWQLIEKAHKPIILCGHGVLMSQAEEALMQFAVKTQTPVASTLLGLGAFPASHPLSLGMMGMHGEAYANNAHPKFRSDPCFRYALR